jgi:hypothetical protein
VAHDPRRVSETRDEREPDRLTTAVRLFTTRTQPGHSPTTDTSEGSPRRGIRRRYPHEALVFDTETLPGPAQNLRFLVWRLYRDRPGSEPAAVCIEEGIAHPDDLDPDSLRTLSEFVATHDAETTPGFASRLRLAPLSWWLEERLFRYGYAHRDRCSVVGFNLLFDLGRLARYWAPAKGRFRGGYSLAFWGRYDAEGKWHDRKYRGRLRLRAIDPRRTLFQWATRERNDPDPDRGPGRFVDLRTLTFALTDRSHTLESACAAFGDPYGKANVAYDTLITPELLEYALEDVRHTGTLYRNCLAELARHPGVGLEPHRLYSPATVGTRYLEAMGLGRPLVKFTRLTGEQLGWDDPPTIERARKPTIPIDEPRGDLDPRLLGWSMSAFYGGRAEARIVRTSVPVCLVDFTAMYPSVNALLGTWSLLRAARLQTNEVTAEVRALIADAALFKRCLTPELWQTLGFTLVELDADGAILPIRAQYDAVGVDFGIGVNPFTYRGRLWYALPDVVAAALLRRAGETPASTMRVQRAIRLLPVGTQTGLLPVQLRGGEMIDPAVDDPFVRMVEERHRVLRDTSLDEQERGRLERFLKITANATAYGVFARFDRRERGAPVELTAFGPDEEPFAALSETPEDPGPFCFPPIAAAITAGARLMLALLERLVTDAGGQYAFCDTDSMAILASPRGSTISCETADGTNRVRALPWRDVRAILARFDQLNPYDPTLVPSSWRVEAESLSRPLHCYAISAKCYCLYRASSDGTPQIVAAVDAADLTDSDQSDGGDELLEDWSEHGLGLYLDPTAPDSDRPRRDDHGRRLWVAAAWRWILGKSQGRNLPLPDWASVFALTRFTVSSPTIEAWFKGYNAARPPAEAIRPGSFGLIAHPVGLTGHDGPRPAAPYQPDPSRWPHLDWFDRRNGQPIRVIDSHSLDPETRAHVLTRGDVPVALLVDILTRYRRRAEHKSLAPDGRATRGGTRGFLLRRPVASGPAETELIGKEGNKLEERQTGEITEPADYRNTYGRRGSIWPTVVTLLHELGAPETARQTDLSRRTVYEVLNGSQPRAGHARAYEALALRFARERLQNWGKHPPDDASALLTDYLAERAARGEDVRRCAWDGKPIPTSRRTDARFCSNRCRLAAHRQRGALDWDELSR